MRTLQRLCDRLRPLGGRHAAGFRGEYGTRWWTYRELHQRSLAAAAFFAAKGVQQRQHIALLAQSSPEWVAVFLGAMRSGIVVVPIDAGAPDDEVAMIVRETGALLLLHGLEQPPAVDCEAVRIDEIWNGSTAEPLAVRVEPADPAVVLFTSGSTGASRGVVLTHANLAAQVRPFLRYRTPLRFLRWRMLALSPLSHVQGLVVGLCVPLSLGLIVLYTDSIAPAHVIRTIREERIRFLSAVPRVLDLLETELRGRFGEKSRAGLVRAMVTTLGRRFRVILTGGAVLPASKEVFWRRAAILVVQGYGLTETSAIATLNLPFFGRLGSIGRAAHRDSIRIAPDGEILVRGEHVSSSAADADGFVHTGDLGKLDSRRRLHFLGRKSEVIVTAEGHNVHPGPIEAMLAARDGVRDAVVTGAERDGLRELHAVLVLDDPRTAGEHVRAVNERLPPHQRLRGWTVWPDADFPRGALHKIKREEVIAGIAVAASEPASGTEPRSIIDCLEERDPRQRMACLERALRTVPAENLEATLLSLGLDSIEFIQLKSRLQPPLAPARTAIATVKDRVEPQWPFWPLMSVPRFFVRTLLLRPALSRRLDVHVEGAQNLAGVRAPFVIALAASNRQHWLDYLAVLHVLPSHLAARLTLVLASSSAFAAYLHPGPQHSRMLRAYVAAMFHVGVPLLVPFTLFPALTPAGTMDGLRRVCSRLGRGYGALLTWGRGTAIIAAETNSVVVPVRIEGNEELSHRNGRRPRITVRFEAPVFPGGDVDPGELHARVARALEVGKAGFR